jgi:hypothetical protein
MLWSNDARNSSSGSLGSGGSSAAHAAKPHRSANTHDLETRCVLMVHLGDSSSSSNALTTDDEDDFPSCCPDGHERLLGN